MLGLLIILHQKVHSSFLRCDWFPSVIFLTVSQYKSMQRRIAHVSSGLLQYFSYFPRLKVSPLEFLNKNYLRSKWRHFSLLAAVCSVTAIKLQLWLMKHPITSPRFEFFCKIITHWTFSCLFQPKGENWGEGKTIIKTHLGILWETVGWEITLSVLC